MFLTVQPFDDLRSTFEFWALQKNNFYCIALFFTFYQIFDVQKKTVPSFKLLKFLTVKSNFKSFVNH